MPTGAADLRVGRDRLGPEGTRLSTVACPPARYARDARSRPMISFMMAVVPP